MYGDSKTRDVIVSIFRSVDESELSKTQLVKIFYICEREYIQEFSERITNIEFIKNHHGPYSGRILRVADSTNCIEVQETDYSTEYIYNEMLDEEPISLSKEEYKFIESIVEDIDTDRESLEDETHDEYYHNADKKEVMMNEPIHS